ncbi:unnamed protein product [Caenorhabditis brenneri]
MAITRWDKETKTTDADKKGGKGTDKEEGMSLADIVADLNKKNPFQKTPMLKTPKTPMKRRREEKDEEEEKEVKGYNRLEYLKEQAKTATIPTEEGSILRPEHIFLETGPLILYLCNDCRKYNGTRPAIALEEGKVQLPLAICTICRAHFIKQRNLKYFEHELPSIKKHYNL